MQCSGYGRPLTSPHLQACPYDACWRLGGKHYCYFHAKLVEGDITPREIKRGDEVVHDISWPPKAQSERDVVVMFVGDHRDRPVYEHLLAEWS